MQRWRYEFRTMLAVHDDSDAILDDILSRWHWLRSSKQIGRGHAPKSLVCGDYRDSRQYDDVNGTLDATLEQRQAKAVDVAVHTMAEPWRTAIYVNARNLYTGREVWHSPRLPVDRYKLDGIVAQARAQLVRLLVSAGVM